MSDFGLRSVFAPESNITGAEEYPLFDLFLNRLNRAVGYRNTLSFRGDFDLFTEAYLEIAEDPITNTWLNVLIDRPLGTLESIEIRVYLQTGRFTASESDDASLGAIALSAASFIESMAEALEPYSGHDRALIALLFFDDLNRFFGLDNVVGFDWSEHLGLPVWRRTTFSAGKTLDDQINVMRDALRGANAFLGT